MSETPNVANLTAITLTQSVLTFVTLLSDPVAIQNGTSDEYANEVRTREVTAVTLSLLVGAGVTIIARSPAPIMFSLLSCVILTGASEYLLAQGRTI